MYHVIYAYKQHVLYLVSTEALSRAFRLFCRVFLLVPLCS